VRFLAVLLLSCAATLAGPTSLTPALSNWKSQIEERGGGSVVIVAIPTDPATQIISLPDDAPFRPVLKRYFLDPAFIEQLARAHALNLNYSGPEGRIHFILVNLALADGAEDFHEALLAHEFGHIWLNVIGYPMPVLRGRKADCAGIHAADLVQHILIRAELDARQIVFRPFWLAHLNRALLEVRQPESRPVSDCKRLSQIALWVDVSLGLNANEWEGRNEFLMLMLQRFPAIEAAAKSIETILREANVAPVSGYRDALLRTYGILSLHTGVSTRSR
jgi:hypothetical protein